MAGFVHILPKIGLKQPSIFQSVENNKPMSVRVILDESVEQSDLMCCEIKVFYSFADLI